MKTLSRFTLPVALALAVSGCATLQSLLSSAFQPPRATLKRAGLEEASLERGTLTTVFIVENPNPIAIEVTDVEYALTIEGRTVAVERPNRAIRVPPRESIELRLPAHVVFAEVVAGGGEPPKRSASHRGEGSFSASGPTGPSRVSLAHEGAFDLPTPPHVTMGVPSLSNLTLTGATVELPLELRNANSFALEARLSGGLSIAGARVATVAESAGDLGTLAAGETRNVRLPLSFALGQVTSAGGALAAATAPLAFEGALQSGSVSVPVRAAIGLPFARFAFSRLEVGEVTFEGVTVNVAFSADNPTDVPLDLGDVQAALFVDGKRAAALKPARQTVAARSRSELVFPIELKFADVSSALVPLFSKGTARLRAEGSFAFATPLGAVRSPIANEVPLALPKLPSVSFGTPRMANLSLTHATLELPLEVTNGNPFPVPLEVVTGAVSIAGARVGSVSLPQGTSLEPGAKRQLVAPITFELLRFINAAQALRTGTASVAFDGSVQSGKLTVPLRWAETVRLAR